MEKEQNTLHIMKSQKLRNARHYERTGTYLFTINLNVLNVVDF